MSLNLYPVRSNLPNAIHLTVRLLGTGASAATIEEGKGVVSSVARLSAGRYFVTFKENFGTYVGAYSQMAGTAPGVGGTKEVNVDGDSYAVTAGVATMEFFVDDDAGALADLASTDRLYLTFVFKTGPSV